MTDPSDDVPEPNPFGDMAEGLQQIFRMFGGAGGGALGGFGAPNWEQARQTAGALANEGVSESNVDPLVRMQYEQLARVAELQIAEATGLTVSHRGITVSPVNRTQWAAATVDAYRPLFEQLSESLGRMMTAQLDDMSGDDMSEMSELLPPGLGIDFSALMSGISSFIGPVMLVTMAGSTVGQLGARAFGSYDLPIPRPATDELLVVATAVDEFGRDWSLDLDDLRLFTCLDEMTHHAVMSIPHVRDRLNSLLCQHAAGFEADAAALEEQLGPVDLGDPDAMASLQASLTNPDFMLSAIRSTRQRELLPYIDALVSTVEGYVDWVVQRVGSRLLGSYPMVREAFRRRRVETSETSRFVEHLFGLELTQAKFDRGSTFIAGVVDRAGESALAALWSDVDHLPTPNELQAPGLWLARVGLADDAQELPELDEVPDIPDFPDLDR